MKSRLRQEGAHCEAETVEGVFEKIDIRGHGEKNYMLLLRRLSVSSAQVQQNEY